MSSPSVSVIAARYQMQCPVDGWHEKTYGCQCPTINQVRQDVARLLQEIENLRSVVSMLKTTAPTDMTVDELVQAVSELNNI